MSFSPTDAGDVQFTLFLALFIIDRDAGLSPVRLFQTLSAQVRRKKAAGFKAFARPIAAPPGFRV